MRVLIIKISSMGDVIHTLPALTDAARHFGGIQFDWVVEQPFAEIPAWHPRVAEVFPFGLRRWRKHWRSALKSGEVGSFVKALRGRRYDAVIDAQGLFKSAGLALLAKGPGHGFDRRTAREGGAALFYRRAHGVSTRLHAITRIRHLFARALGYEEPQGPPEFDLAKKFPRPQTGAKDLIFFHGTTWDTKHWPLPFWRELAQLAASAGHPVQLSVGNDREQARAKVIADGNPGVAIIPKGDLTRLAQILGNARGFVGVDTGLSHLAGALNVPGVTLYGPTDPALTAPLREKIENLGADFSCAPCKRRRCHHPDAGGEVDPPCFSVLEPAKVWQTLLQVL